MYNAWNGIQSGGLVFLLPIPFPWLPYPDPKHNQRPVTSSQCRPLHSLFYHYICFTLPHKTFTWYSIASVSFDWFPFLQSFLVRLFSSLCWGLFIRRICVRRSKHLMLTNLNVLWPLRVSIPCQTPYQCYSSLKLFQLQLCDATPIGRVAIGVERCQVEAKTRQKNV